MVGKYYWVHLLGVTGPKEASLPNILGRMVSGSMWLSGARLITNILAFMSMIVLARLLTPSDFGIVALGMTVLAIINAVTEMSLSQALIHHKNPQENHFHTAWTLGAARGFILALLMCGLAKPLVWLYTEPRLELVIYALAFSVFISGLGNPRRIMLAKELIFWQEFFLIVAQRLTTVVISIAVALIWQNYWALIVGTVIGQAVGSALSYLILPFRPKVMWQHTKELWSFSVWLTLGQAINTINWRFDQLLVGGVLGRAALGHYSVGDNLAQMPTREATAPLQQTLFPALAKIADEPHRLRHAYQRAQALITYLALPIGVGFALVAEPVVIAFLGEKWLPAVPVIQALSSVFALQTLGSMVQPLGMAMGYTKLLFKRDLQMFFVRLPIIIAGTVLYGLPGLIYARVGTGLIGALVNMFLIKKMTDLTVAAQLLVNLRTLFATCIMVIAALGIQAWLATTLGAGKSTQVVQILATIGLGALAYVIASGSLWLMLKRPEGPEREVITLTWSTLRSGAQRFKAWRSS